MKFALEHQNPLVTGAVTGGSAYPATSYSLLTLSNPNVLLWALKPSEEGILSGLIARVWNLSASAATFSLALAGRPILTAQRATHIETPIEAAAVRNGVMTADLNPRQLGTFALDVFDLEKKVYLPTVRSNS
jgi:alpha-mannosidase